MTVPKTNSERMLDMLEMTVSALPENQRSHKFNIDMLNLPFPEVFYNRRSRTTISDMEKDCWRVACALANAGKIDQAKRHFRAVLTRTVQVEQAYYKKGMFILATPETTK